LRLTITADDIAQGKRSDTSCCPIALSFRRTAQKERIRVAALWVVAPRIVCATDVYKGIQRSWAMPEIAGKWLIAFDKGETVSPLSFELREEVNGL
jgi:hypothetical protein